MSDEVKVTIVLRRHVAERLRGMCHTRGMTASLMVEEWVFEHDDNGKLKALPTKTSEFMDSVKDILKKTVGKDT